MATVIIGGFAYEQESSESGSLYIPPHSDLNSRAGGRHRGGEAVAVWEPPVVEFPEGAKPGERRMYAAAFGPVTMFNAQAQYSVSDATAPSLRTRIVIGNIDVSYYRGVMIEEPSYQLAEPLLWGPTRIELPQIAAAFEKLGEGELSWCRKGASVRFQRVTADGDIVSTDYRGIVVAYDVSGAVPALEVGGHGAGRAALRYKPVPIFRDTLDIGRHGWAAMRDLGVGFEPRLGPDTGIRHGTFGGMDYLTYIAELCAKAWERDGTRWTIMPVHDRVYGMHPKDTETVHFTVFNDDERSQANLRSDLAEEPNRVFATGVTPKGQRVRFGVYPGLKPAPAPPYPMADMEPFGVGTTDEDTSTGDGVFVMVRKLWTAGFLSLEDAVGAYDFEVDRAIRSLQRQAGLPASGNMNPATWKALFDVETTGHTIRGSRVEPAAQLDSVRRYNRSASGQVIEKNPDYDSRVVPVDRAIDFGSGFTRHRMREWSRTEIEQGTRWTGSIVIKTGAVLTGQVDKGATVTEGMLMDVRAIKPGMNAWLPMFHGGTLIHVSGVEISFSNGLPVATLTVDTDARDGFEVWEAIRRARETRKDPARRWRGNHASGEVKDSITEWDEVGGVLYGNRVLSFGWNVYEIVAGMEGTVSRLRIQVDGGTTPTFGDEDYEEFMEAAEFSGSSGVGAEFACAIFGERISAKRLNKLVPDPLGEEGQNAWEDSQVQDILRGKKLLYSAGTFEEPCGYTPGRKSKGAYCSGLHRDDAGFSYRTGQEPILYLAIWSGVDHPPATLRDGRIMWNLLEAGV